MSKTLFLFSLGLLLLSDASALAHHSIDAEFDTSRTLELTGKVTKVEWTNPHTWFFLDVRNPDTGRVETWACEAAGANGLERRGWTQDSLRVGDVVTVSGMPSRNGSNKANAVSLILPDGQERRFAPSDATATPEP